MSKYDFILDLDTDNSVSLIIDMIESNSKVLEFGPANGRMTKYLSEKMQCNVDIVEIDEDAGIEASKYSNKSFIGEALGDIENYTWLEELKNEKYDYILFADVLEHLHSPNKVLKVCNRILKDNGSIIMSIPNCAHNSVIIDLINDEFRYNQVGLLDNTHISFFAYKSLLRMIEESGYKTVIERATYSRVGENEINNNYNSVNKEFAKALRKRDNGNLYQFVFQVKKKDYEIICSPLKEVNLDMNSEYEFKCYIKEEIDGNYIESKKISKFINPGHNIIELEFSKFKEIHGLRIDPIEGNCVIDIKDIYTIIDNKKVDINILETNGINLIDSIYMFSTIDPQIYLDIKGININTLYYDYSFIDYDSNTINKYEELLKNIIEYKNLSINEKDQIIEHNTDVINEKEQIIAYNTAVVNEKEQIIESSINIINEKEQIIEANIKKILEYKILVDETKSQLEVENKENYKLREQIAIVEGQLKNKQKYIDDIHNSRGWKILCRMKKMLGK